MKAEGERGSSYAGAWRNSNIAEKIRTVILDNNHTEMDAKTEALLYAAARRQHLVEKVIPALERVQLFYVIDLLTVHLLIKDMHEGLGLMKFLQINQFAIGNTMPDLTVFFDINPEEGLARIAQEQ